jgi:hypothetical protein
MAFLLLLGYASFFWEFGSYQHPRSTNIFDGLPPWHTTFTSMLHFHLKLTSNHFTCECGHKLNAFGIHLTHCSFGGQRITTHDAIQNVMYALVQESGHVVWKEWWYVLMSRVSLWIDIYMTWENQIFIVNMVFTNPTWETMASSVITWPIGVATKLNVIAEIYKNKRLHEGHHFIPMAMEVHGAFGHDINHSI